MNIFDTTFNTSSKKVLPNNSNRLSDEQVQSIYDKGGSVLSARSSDNIPYKENVFDKYFPRDLSSQQKNQNLNIKIPFTQGRTISIPTGNVSGQNEITNFVGALPADFLEFVSKGVVTGFEEIKNLKDGGGAKVIKLSPTLANFYGSPEYSTVMQDVDKRVANGDGLASSYIGAISEKALDVSVAGSIVASGWRALASKLSLKDDVLKQIEGWKLMGSPATKQEYKTNVRQLAQQFYPKTQGADDSVWKVINGFKTILDKEGLPSVINKAKQNVQRYAEWAGRESRVGDPLFNLDLKLKNPTATKLPLQALPGYTDTTGYPLGLSTKAIEPVGFGEKSNNFVRKNIEASQVNANKVREDTLGGLREEFRLTNPIQFKSAVDYNAIPYKASINDEVPIFRVVTKGSGEKINIGDEVTTDIKNARRYLNQRGEGSFLIEDKVPISALVKSQGKGDEFIYSPKPSYTTSENPFANPNASSDKSRIQELRNSINEGKTLLRSKSLSSEERASIIKSIDNAQTKIGVEKMDGYTVEEISSDQIFNGQVSKVDRLISEGKIRVVSRDGKDVYQVKKGDKWMNARDEDSAVKQVTQIKKKTFELSTELQNKKILLEIKQEALDANPAKDLAKFASKSGDFKGGLKEVTGKKGSEFGQRGDQIITELGFSSSEEARGAFDNYIKQKEELNSLKEDIKQSVSKEKAEGIILSEKAKQVPKVLPEKEQVLSLENLAEQALNKVDSPFREKVSPLEMMIEDTATNVKEKVNAFDYLRTPDRVLKKIGLSKVAEYLRFGYDNYLAELPKHLEVITDWSKEVSKESNQKIFKFLDGQNISLDGKELKVANEIKEYLQEWAIRLNLPDDNQISHYITHIFEIGEKQKEFSEEIANLIKDKVPGSVYDPFLEKRLGAKGYVEDTWRALDAYVKRAVRKVNMDPALEQLKSASTHLEESQLNYVTRLGARINMRPTEWDNLLDNTIKQLAGYRFGQRPTAVISGTLRRMIYRGALGLNIGSAVRNLTQGVNTFAKLGVRDTLTGYISLLKPSMSKELSEVGILRDGFIQDRSLSAAKQFLQKADKGLFFMFELAEKINRGSAYFGAKSKAIRQGKSELEAIEYAKKLTRDTQFVFGSIDTPVALQGDIAKTLFQFGSFSQKQIEFLSEMAKQKEYAGIIRYIVASLGIVYTVGKTFNIKGSDFNPLNYFSRFGKPPSLALPIEVIKAVTNMPDQYGKTPSTKTKVKNIIYSGKTLIPAGIQASKLLKGDVFGGEKKKKKSSSTESNPFNSF